MPLRWVPLLPSVYVSAAAEYLKQDNDIGCLFIVILQTNQNVS